VGPTIARRLGLTEQPDRAIVDQLRGYLERRTLLLVLDSFEHLLAARSLVGDLMAAAPRLRVVVTSRIVLNLLGEHEYRVEPLGLPDPDGPLDPEALGRSEAVELFVERARASSRRSRSRPRTVSPSPGRIRLDGLPRHRAAASRVRMLEPHDFLPTRAEAARPRRVPAGPRYAADAELGDLPEPRLCPRRNGRFRAARDLRRGFTDAAEMVGDPDCGSDRHVRRSGCARPQPRPALDRG
jgi:hypothetical protein